MRRLILTFLGAALLAGCSLGGDGPTTRDDSESLVTVTSMKAAAGPTKGQSVITSDVSEGGSDLADVTFQNTTKSVAITAPSTFFGVTLTRYRVVFSRGDAGPVPAPFEAAISLFVPPPSTQNGVITPGTASATIVVVPASAKTTSPLKDLPEAPATGQQIAASATITFEGQDGHGRRLSTTGGIAVLFQP